MKRIVITGGCGFIGTNLIHFLQKKPKKDLQIIVLDNETVGKREYISEFDVQFVPGDITDQKLLPELFDGADAIVHLAADTRVIDSIRDPANNFENNVTGTFYLLNAAREKGVSLIVNASTGGAILGEVKPPVHETMFPQPISPYGASKLAGEGYCSAFQGSYGIRACSLRFSNVYGPRSFHKGSVVAAFFKNILSGEKLKVFGDGAQVRDYVFVDDICRGIANALEKGASGVFQLGTGVPTTINLLISKMIEVVDGEYEVAVEYHEPRDGEIHSTYSDISKARKEIGYHPSVGLAEGLGKTWEWFKENFQGEKPTHYIG